MQEVFRYLCENDERIVLSRNDVQTARQNSGRLARAARLFTAGKSEAERLVCTGFNLFAPRLMKRERLSTGLACRATINPPAPPGS
jgi:hypothetical protein